jgi:hypothetical protein
MRFIELFALAHILCAIGIEGSAILDTQQVQFVEMWQIDHKRMLITDHKIECGKFTTK